MGEPVAVVVSDAVGLPELVDDTCGWVVPAEDAEDQRRKIERLLEYVRTLPVRTSGPWKREDLYE